LPPQWPSQTLIDCLIGFLINEQSNSDLLLGFIFVSLPFELFQKRGPHKVGDANKFMPRCALNFEVHGVRYTGLDRSAVGGRKYFTALALSKGVGLRFSGHGAVAHELPELVVPRRQWGAHLAADAASDLHTTGLWTACAEVSDLGSVPT
jgi:hypothetical protein